MWSSYTVKYYPSIQKNKALMHAVVWMNLKNIMLHDKSQKQNVTYYTISFICPGLANP